jgi:hypothetical protein
MIQVIDENVFEIKNDQSLVAFMDWYAKEGEPLTPEGKWQDMVAFQAGWAARDAEVIRLMDQIRGLESQIFGGSVK